MILIFTLQYLQFISRIARYIFIIDDQELFVANSARITFNSTTMVAAMGLIGQYENERGVLFVNVTGTTNGFSKVDAGMTDGLELERAMMTISQAVLDQVYHGSIWNSIHNSDSK